MQIDARLVENDAAVLRDSNPFPLHGLTDHSSPDSARGGGGDERVRRNTLHLHDSAELLGE